ncbi:MAG: acyl-CoA dehydrogenase family protein [Dehalococcoidia bacterium]|nr:acyl-CoA dehydrogenase family protein [Dehalococcoidia bacterium]
MQFELTEEQESLRQLARKVAREEIEPQANERDEKGEFPWDMVKVLAKHGFYALSIPEQYGGSGGKILDLCVVGEEIAKVCNNCYASLTFGLLGPYPILLGGSEEQKHKYLPRFATGELLGSYALSEPGAGSDAASLQTKAIREDDKTYIISGSKKFISQFDASSICIMFVRTNPEVKPSRGISAFIVEKKPNEIPGWATNAEAMPKMGMRAMHTYEFSIENLRVPQDNLIGKEGDGFSIAMQTLDRGRISVAAQAVGIAQGALDHAIRYARNRKQFGVPIGTFQGLQFMLADMAIQTEAARQLTYMAASHADSNGPNVGLYGAMAKCFASDAAMKTTTDAVQVLGGSGYMRDLPLERLMRDAKVTQIYEGTNQIQRIVVSRSLLGRL